MVSEPFVCNRTREEDSIDRPALAGNWGGPFYVWGSILSW